MSQPLTNIVEYYKIKALYFMEKVMAKQFVDVYGITKEEVVELSKMLPEGVSVEKFLFNLKILKIRYGLSNFDISKIVEHRLDLVASNDILDRLSAVQIRYNIKDEKISEVFRSWKVRYFGLDLDYLERLRKEVGLTRNEMSSVITHSKIAFYKTDLDDIKRNIEILNKAGLDRANLWRGTSILSSKPKRIVDLIMIGMMQGYDVNTFVMSNYHRVLADTAYSRMRAAKDGLIPKALVYAADFDFKRCSNGITDEELIAKYSFDYRERIRFEREFLQKFDVAPELLEYTAEDFIRYANQESHRNDYKSPENATANKQKLIDGLGFSEAEVDGLMHRCVELNTIDTGILSHNISVLTFLVGGANLARCIMSCPKLVATESNEIMHSFEELHNKYGVTRTEFAFMILNDPMLPMKDLNALEDFCSDYSATFGATKQQCKNFLVSNQYVCFNEDFYKDRLEVLKAFGATAKVLDTFESPAKNTTETLLLKLKLAFLNGASIEDFVAGKYKQSVYKTYARLMGVYSGEISYDEVYLKASGRQHSDNVREDEVNRVLMANYPFTNEQAAKIDKIFAAKFPEIQEKLDLIKQRKDEEFSNAIKEQKASDSLIKRFKRLCGISEEQAKELIAKLGPFDQELFARVVLNVFNLKKIGFKVEDLIAMPRILKCEPEDIQIKAALSNMAGKSSGQFIKRNYEYSAKSVYAKMMESKERGVPAYKLYDSNKSYLKSLKRLSGEETSLEELKKKHPLDDNAIKSILEPYNLGEEDGGISEQ